MTSDHLTTALAQQVMGWGAGPDRFLMGRRRWKPRWRFQPLTDLADAFSILDKAADRYTLTGGPGRTFTACVQIGKRKGSLAVAPVSSAQEGKQSGVLRDRQDLAIAECPVPGGKIPRENSDLTKEWI